MSISKVNCSIFHPCSSCRSGVVRVSQFNFRRRRPGFAGHAASHNGFTYGINSIAVEMNSSERNNNKGSPEALFCYDKSIPEEIIEYPIGLSIDEKKIGSYPRCNDCQVKGAVLCTTCSGSGLYVDSILESQGVIVKVRCLGCGGTGNIMCCSCGGRGHL